MKFNYLFFGPTRKLIFLKDFLQYILSGKSEFLEVKLSKIKTSFRTTRMQILRQVTYLWAEVVGITHELNNNTRAIVWHILLSINNEWLEVVKIAMSGF